MGNVETYLSIKAVAAVAGRGSPGRKTWPAAAGKRSETAARSENRRPSAGVASFTAIRSDMIIADLNKIEGRRYPARRRTQNLVGGVSPIQAKCFAIGNVTLDPHGGQVPWHNQEQEEVYFVIEGTGEMCLGEERQVVTSGQAVYIPSGVFHQMTNIGDTPLRMLYCYGPPATWPTGGRSFPERFPCRHRGPAAARRGPTAMHGKAGVADQARDARYEYRDDETSRSGHWWCPRDRSRHCPVPGPRRS